MVRVLAVSDVDLPCANRLVEWALSNGEQFDLMCVVGLFDGERQPSEDDENGVYKDKPLLRRSAAMMLTVEERAVREGEMTAIITQLENIVCRVVYIPWAGYSDKPPSAKKKSSSSSSSSSKSTSKRKDGKTDQAGEEAQKKTKKAVSPGGVGQGDYRQLTANSKNINERTLRLCSTLYAMGLSEPLYAVANEHGSVWTEKALTTEEELAVLRSTVNSNFLKVLAESMSDAAAGITHEDSHQKGEEGMNGNSAEEEEAGVFVLCSAIMGDIRKPAALHEQSWMHGFWDMEVCQQNCVLHLTAGAWLGAGLDNGPPAGRGEDGYGVVGTVTIVDVPSLKETGMFCCLDIVRSPEAENGRWVVRNVAFESLVLPELDDQS